MSVPVTIVRGDLTDQGVDAIVNAANEALLGGGGVDGAIHRAAGPQLLEACRAFPEVQPGVRCPTGLARITPGFQLKARWVVHTVGPVFSAQREGECRRLLTAAHEESLQLAVGRGLRTIAFPAISCGVFGYPLPAAAAVAAKVARGRDWDLDEIRFVLFGEDTLNAYREAFGLDG